MRSPRPSTASRTRSTLVCPASSGLWPPGTKRVAIGPNAQIPRLVLRRSLIVRPTRSDFARACPPVLVEVVAPRAARRKAEEPLGFGARDPGGVLARERTDLDLVAVVAADELGERAAADVVGRRDVEDLVAREVGLGREHDR